MKTAAPAHETLPQLIRRSLAQPRDAVLLERSAAGWVPTSSSQLLARVENIACAIREAGLSSGDRVALIAADSVDWVATDFAILVAGCVVVPIYPTQAPEHVAFILKNSEAKLIFTDTGEAAERLRRLNIALPPIVIFEQRDAGGLSEFERRGAQAHAANRDWPQKFEEEIEPDDLAVLIYTSGTTGEPKGVMLSHHNIAFNAESSFGTAFETLPPGSTVLSVLPFSHIYEHMIVYGYLLSGMHHYICHSPDDLLRDLREVRPIEMTVVPRIFERVLAAIVTRAKQSGPLRARLVPWALGAGREYMTAKIRGTHPGLWRTLAYRIAYALVLRKIRPLLGLDRLKFFTSGSAALHLDIAMTLLACDIPIVEGYGPTECSPVVSVNTLETNRYGTVGKPIPGMEVKIADDGEILTRGPSVMLGYYKDASSTASALEGGWYHTGDVGELDADGFLRITDRKNELFKTSGGKFIAPARVEASIKRSVYVNQAMVVGSGRAHPVALVSPNWDLVRMELGMSQETPQAELAQRGDVKDFLAREVCNRTSDLASYEQVRRIVILPDELSIEAGELSPSLKIKRRIVERRYASDIERAYADG